jgi:omega-6 fatty acid desaturase (delta-12 desaturase)
LYLILNWFPTRGVTRHQKISVLITNLADLFIFAWPSGRWACRMYAVSRYRSYCRRRRRSLALSSTSSKASPGSQSPVGYPDRLALGLLYYKLPNILHWLTGNIGIHHIHHTRTAIPNYNLQQCFNETPELQEINVLTIRRSLKSLWLNLWDEDQNKLVSFRESPIKSARSNVLTFKRSPFFYAAHKAPCSRQEPSSSIHVIFVGKLTAALHY